MNEHGYTYSIVRYVHDPVAGECLNVGVVLHSGSDLIEVRFPASLNRIQHAFPGASAKTIRQSFDSFESRLKSFMRTTNNFAESLSLALPPDDGGLKASELGGGVAHDLGSAADELLDRFVLMCERGFADAQVTENKEYRVAWHFGGEVSIPTPSNDDMYQLADFQMLRA